jgi:hypothetical protein
MVSDLPYMRHLAILAAGQRIYICATAKDWHLASTQKQINDTVDRFWEGNDDPRIVQLIEMHRRVAT